MFYVHLVHTCVHLVHTCDTSCTLTVCLVRERCENMLLGRPAGGRGSLNFQWGPWRRNLCGVCYACRNCVVKYQWGPLCML